MENWKKTFGIIWSGQLASILSSSVVGYAIIFWMSIETGSAEVLALAAIAGMLPQSLLGPVVGVYVDRWDRKRTMILADSFIAFCTLILAVLFWFDVAQMWHIYILLACRSVGSAFHSPSMQASVPLLAPEAQLTRVAGINQIINSLSNIIGPALGAVLSCIEGIAGGIFNASFVAVVQTRIDAGVLGRVMSLYYSFGLLPSAIGLLGTGFLAEQVGLTTTFVIAGLVICTLGLTAFCIPSVMRLDRQSKSAEHQTQATDGK